jgi:sialidase-1
LSENGGHKWTVVTPDEYLPDPHCQGSVINSQKIASAGFYPLYFTNVNNLSSRTNLTLRKSIDGGKTWINLETIKDRFTAYSDLAILEDGRIAWIYESAEKQDYDCIKLIIKKFDD